jgi:hypothetical protein
MSATALERPKRHVGCAAVGDYDVVVEPLRIRLYPSSSATSA